VITQVEMDFTQQLLASKSLELSEYVSFEISVIIASHPAVELDDNKSCVEIEYKIYTDSLGLVTFSDIESAAYYLQSLKKEELNTQKAEAILQVSQVCADSLSEND